VTQDICSLLDINCHFRTLAEVLSAEGQVINRILSGLYHMTGSVCPSFEADNEMRSLQLTDKHKATFLI
jgi:hypothetical protein